MRSQAIRNTHSTVVTVNSETDAWDKDGNVVVLDESKITTEVARLEADYDAKQYQRDRQPEYPSIPDQLDKIYHSGINEWKKDIKAVKDKYPKP
jgi:hypothetical protein